MFAHLKRALWKGVLLTMLVSLLGFTIGLAAAGDLDTTFSGDGIQTTDFGGWHERVDAIALQSDGKIIAVGERYKPGDYEASTTDFALARYHANGSLDTTFSGDGKQTTSFGAIDYALGVAIQSNGKIVVSGEKCYANGICSVAVARYTTAGSLDTTFSGDGRQVLNFGTGTDDGGGAGIAISPSGKIVVAGHRVTSAGDYDFAVYRLNADGSPDPTFSGDGKVSFGFGAGRQDFSSDLVVQGEKAVIVGTTCATSGVCDFAIARLKSDGSLDTMFSSDGKNTTDFGGDDHAAGVALQSDGKLVAAGFKYLPGNQTIAVARYKSDGTRDATFSGDGKLTIPFSVDAWANDVLVQGNGKIVLAGTADDGVDYDLMMVRLLPGGSLDTTFSGDGRLRTDYGGVDNGATSVVKQPDGKYLTGGRTSAGGDDDFYLVRILN